MELTSKAFYVAVLLVCSLIASSEAVTCYTCNSTLEKGCFDPFKSDGIDTCEGVACLKVSGVVEGSRQVSRSCWNMSPAESGCMEASFSNVKGTFCMCTSDRCNSAKSIIPSAWLLAVVGVLSLSATTRN